jgi:DNA polymerase elongation subunit (family B)
MFKSVFYDKKENKIYLWEKINGNNVLTSEKFEYQYYTLDSSNNSDFKTIDGRSVKQNLTDSKNKIESLKKYGIEVFESDLNEEISFLHRKYNSIDLKPNYSEFNICYIDIETESDQFPKPEESKYEINLITVYSTRLDKTYTWGNRPYNKTISNGEYYYIQDEKTRLLSFIEKLNEIEPDIISGWNVVNFDMQYISNRFKRLKLDFKEISPNKKVREYIQTNTQNQDIYHIKIGGIAVLDYLELYKNFTFENLESYSLQFVSITENLGGKLDLDGHINDAYLRDWDKFVEYNIQDVILVKQIDDIKKFISLTIDFCSEAKIPFERVYSSISVIEGYILNTLHKKNIVVPDKQENISDRWNKDGLYKHDNILENVLHENGESTFEDFAVKGGHVEAIQGFYKHILSFDVTSLYPHNIMQFNISPETKVYNPNDDEIKENDYIKSPLNGIYYKKEKGFLPEIISGIFNDRKFHKNKMFEYSKIGNKELERYHDSQQMIRKILINSFYGTLANKGFRFYDVDNARVVTRAGRTLIRYLSDSVNRYFKEKWHIHYKKYFPNAIEHKIENCVCFLQDTDSLYLCLDEIKTKYAPDMDFREFALYMETEFFKPFFDKLLDHRAKKYNVEQVIHFKREGIILKQFVLAKKKYLTQIIQNEEKVYSKPKIKATGVEIRRSDTPKFCRDNIEKIVEILFDGEYPDKDKIISELKKIKSEFKKQDISEISFNKSVKEFSKYSGDIENMIINKNVTIKKGTPIHHRATIYYNYIVKKDKLQYIPVSDQSKIKYIYIDDKNLFATNIIGYVGNFPKEFHGYFKIDYDLQFEKSFLGIIQRMFDVLGWGKIQLKKNRLEELLN